MADETPEATGFDAKIKSWWSGNKILFFLALPLILLWVFRNVVIGMLANSTRKIGEEAKKEDSQLKATADQAAMDAAVAQAEAKAAAKRVEDRKEDDIPEDWNKKSGKDSQ